MTQRIELPLTDPGYSTYHFQGPSLAVTSANPSIRNWTLSNIMILSCERRFLRGYTSPDIKVVDSWWNKNPYLEKYWYSMRFTKGHTNCMIREMLEEGFYVPFSGIDDYYVSGKSWYRERHFSHDGMVCGFDRADKTFCIYAYDSHWIYRKFWTPWEDFNRGRRSILKQGGSGSICAIRPKFDKVLFSAQTACSKIGEYLNSDLEKYPPDQDGTAYGIIVHDYISMYVGKLFDGSIPYERMDRRVFRQIWEHKKLMLERLALIEQELELDTECSSRYAPLVALADGMRMLYASHHMRRRDSVLPILQKKLEALKRDEEEILNTLIGKTKGKFES